MKKIIHQVHSNKRLSIVVPMYNAERFIRRCLESCLSQDMDVTSYEIIVIDDGSTDFSSAIVKNIATNHKNVLYYYQRNQGQGAARNLGIAKAVGDYIAFVDADDYLIVNSISVVLNMAEAMSADIARSLMEVEDADGAITSRVYKKCFLDSVFKGEEALLLLKDIGSVCGTLYLRNFLIKNHFLFMKGIKHEDVAFNYNVYPKANRFIFLNVMCYHYCYNVGSTDRTTDKEKKKMLMYSDLCIASLLKKMASEEQYTKELQRFFSKTSNSILVSSLFSVLRCSSYQWKDYIWGLGNLQLLPVKGCTRSWKTSLAIPFMNVFCFLRVKVCRMTSLK